MANASKVIAVDLGSTYFKICRFNEAGQLEGVQTVPAPVARPTRERAEISIEKFRECLSSAIRDIATRDGQSESVQAITFATQANTFALFDQHDDALTPFVLWSDIRAQGNDFPLRSLSLSNEFKATTGVAAVDHLFMPAKVHWFRRYELQTTIKASRIALLSDYFTKWLTGIWCTEAATAALSGLVDIHELAWWPAACDAAQIPFTWLPSIVRAGTDLGPMLPRVADELGLPRQCRFIVGCLDQYAGAIGAGNVKPGCVSETTGTVLATIRCSETHLAPDNSDNIFQGPAFAAGLYYQMVFSEQSAGILERFRNSLSKMPSFAELDRLAGESPPGARGLRLHAAAFGRDPTNIFVDRQRFHTLGDEVRAIFEGVAQELKRQVGLLCGGDLPTVVYAAGGAAKSQLWLDIKSKTLGRPVVAVECPEPTARGAALLALATCQERNLADFALASTAPGSTTS